MDLTDEQWAVVGPWIGEMPRRADGRGRPWRSSREVLNGALWFLRTGAQWTDLPRRLIGDRAYDADPLDEELARHPRGASRAQICEVLVANLGRPIRALQRRERALRPIQGSYRASLLAVGSCREIPQQGFLCRSRAIGLQTRVDEAPIEAGIGLIHGRAHEERQEVVE
jgi:hypothetical protein